MVQLIKTKEEFDKIIKSNLLVIVDFYADWCGPCRMISPKFEEMESNYRTVFFVKVNVDENSETAVALGISAMPTFLVFKNGQKVDELVGANELQLKNLLEKWSA